MNELQLDEVTYARAKRLADEKNVSIEAIVAEAIDHLSSIANGKSPESEIIGAFSDCTDLLDEIVREAYLHREQVPLRLKTE